MVTRERNNALSSYHSIILDSNGNLSEYDWHSIVLNASETRLLLVNNQNIAFVNFETSNSGQIDNHIGSDDTNLIPFLNNIPIVQLFDSCNTNRSVAEWNSLDRDQFAVAIDRHVRLYSIDRGCINETSTSIDSQHQRPISTISFSPKDSALLLTGALDGKIHLWDTRNTQTKNPPCLKLTVSTPFSIRRIKWSTEKSDNANHLAVQCDRCVRIYDIRQPGCNFFQAIDLEHTQRILNMELTNNNSSIVTLSTDQSLRIFSINGETIAESLSYEQSPYNFTKLRTTKHDNLFICASRDTTLSTFGFLGWYLDENQYLRPLTDRIVSTTSSAIVDFYVVNNSRFLNLFFNSFPARYDDESFNPFLLLTLCRDGHLSLVDMDSTFRQAWPNNFKSNQTTNLVSSSRASRTIGKLPSMEMIKDEQTTIDGMDSVNDRIHDDEAFQALPASPLDTIESSDISDESDSGQCSDTNTTLLEISIENELNTVQDHYGNYIFVELKDVGRRMCTIRCIYSIENSLSFRIYLILSRHYPIISQLFVRFKLSTNIYDHSLKLFQQNIQKMFDETSSNCFYRGRLCLHKCLTKLYYLFERYHDQKKITLKQHLLTNNTSNVREQSTTNTDIDHLAYVTNNNSNNSINNNLVTDTSDQNSTRLFGTSSSTRTTDSQMSNTLHNQGRGRTCGARFSGGIHLICFGRIPSNQVLNSVPITTPLNDGTSNRVPSLPIRSTSLTVTKSRENSSTDEPSSYRPSTTNTLQIQHGSANQRLPTFSAPVRSILNTNAFNENTRLSSLGRRSIGQMNHPHSTVSLYDVSILLPISKKLADDYKIDLNNSIDMCESNEKITREMGKDDLSHCWRLLGGLLSLQPNLKNDDSWFQTPIAQGLIKHLVANYVSHGDIQSASMFLLTMSQTPYLKTKIQSRLVQEHDYDPILYAYASLLHRWKHFYKRTQILSQIDHNCQSPAPVNQTFSTTITCSICLQPVLGQHFLCAACGHGGHLTHLHEWFSSEELKHKLCPEKDCSCRCIIKQQGLLIANAPHMQQQTSITGSRAGFPRQPSNSVRS